MKKYVLLVAVATLTHLLCLNVGYSNPSDVSVLDDFCDKTSSNHSNYTPTSNSTLLSIASCASSCGSISAGNDCGHAIYEGQNEFMGSAANSTTNGDGSGTGCQYYGYATALQLGAGTGTSYTYCTEYTANSEEASYATYLSAANSSCLSRSVQIYESNTCGVATVGLQQPIGAFPAKATALRPGDTYVVCHTYTENGCADNFQSSIFEVCMNIVELPYCSSAPAPQATMEVCSGESFEIDLGNACVADSDLTTGFNNGLSGFAAFYYQSGDRYVSFPEDITAGSIGSSIFIRYFGESNVSNGGNCSPIVMNPIINTSCDPLEVVVGIVPVDVNSVDGPILNVLSDCRITEVTLTVYPQLTSQVTGSSIQLLTEDGTVCDTYSGTSPTPTISANVGANPLLSSVLNGGTFNTNNPLVGTRGQTQTIQTVVPINPGSGGAGIPDDIPCVIPNGGGLLAVNDNGETLIAHTVENNGNGELVFTYELPVQRAKLYPNPATSQLFFSTGAIDTYTVRIYDTFGKQVFVGQTNDDTAIDIQHLASGLYTYSLEDNRQNIFDHGKWVKQ